MKEIQLTQGKITLVDDEDFEKLNKFKWCTAKKGNNYYAVRGIRKDKVVITISMHNQILSIKGVDHINGNGLDNRRSNLRLANHSQNMANSKKQNGLNSTYKGVYLLNLCKGKYKYWIAQITKDREQIYLGCFKSETEAALIYNNKAGELFGKFARLNEVIT